MSEQLRHEPLGDLMYVEPYDEYLARCSCGREFRAYVSDAVEESLWQHVEDPDE